jgi:cytochrome c biogenesis protein CcmG/thiol:disulfide interchange protein DsbE
MDMINQIRSTSMHKKLIIIFLLAVFTAAGCQQNPKEEPAPGNGTTVNDNSNNGMPSDKAPDFTLKNTEGNNVSLADYKGKIILIDFWATWCPPCRKGIPDLVELQKQYKDDFVVIGISLDREKTIKDVVPFVKEYKINYPVVYGDENVANKFGGIQAIPTSFIIDKNGNIVDKHVGLVDKSVYENKIKEIMSGS